MPELPEIEAWRRALEDPVSASPIVKAGPAHVATLKTFDPPLSTLEGRRLAVSQDDNELFVYASSQQEAEHARQVVEAELAEEGIEARTSQVERWLPDEERWSNEPAQETWEEEELDRGYAP